MPDHSGLRGTDVGQDTRFKDKEAASIKATKFPANFTEKVDLRKVNIAVLKPWIAKKVIELIRVDDDIVVEFVFSMLEDRDSPMPDPKKLQVSLLGFMDKYGAAAFMEELWTLLLSAQSSTGGIPATFLQAKKAEIQNRQATEGQRPSSEVLRMGAMIPPSGRPGASDMFDQKPRDFGPPGRQGSGRDGDRRNDRDRDNGYGSRGPPQQSGRYDDRPPPGRGGGDRGRDNGYGNRGPPRRSPSPRRDRGRGGRDDRGPPRGDRESHRSDRDDRQRRPTPPRRPSPSSRRRSPSPPPRRRARGSDTPPARKRGTSPTKEKAGISKRGPGGDRDDTPPMRRARSPSRSVSRSPPPPRRRARSASRTPTPSDPGGRSRSPTVTPPRRHRDDTPPRKKRDASTPPRKRKGSSTPPPRKRRSPSRSISRSPPPVRKRRHDSSPSPPPKERREKGEGRSKVSDGDGGKSRGDDARKSKKKLDGALGKSRWADDE